MIKDFEGWASKYSEQFRIRSDGYNFPRIEFFRHWGSVEEKKSQKITASMPICNQAQIIRKILTNFFEKTLISTKLIIILDACTDETEKEIVEFLDSPERSFIFVSEVLVFRTKKDIFESSCDNFAFSLTETPYFLTIQADNFLNDETYLPRAIQALNNFPRLAAISTRGVVPFDHPRRIPHKQSRIRQTINFPSRLFPKVFKSAYLGPFFPGIAFFGDVSAPPKTKLKFGYRDTKTVFIGEAIVRGPILWRSEYLQLVNGFDDVAYFLGWDDYDVSYRLFQSYKFRVGYLASTAYSLINSGTNSFPRSPATQLEYRRREELAKLHPGSISKYWEDRDKSRVKLDADWSRWVFEDD